ncbi:TPA: transcriptional regulator [Neisseria meningitidis]
MSPYEKLINHFGSSLAVARELNMAAPSVFSWKTKKIPIIRCIEIENITDKKITRKDLRPDDWHLIWPELADGITNLNGAEK